MKSRTISTSPRRTAAFCGSCAARASAGTINPRLPLGNALQTATPCAYDFRASHLRANGLRAVPLTCAPSRIASLVHPGSQTPPLAPSRGSPLRESRTREHSFLRRRAAASATNRPHTAFTRPWLPRGALALAGCVEAQRIGASRKRPDSLFGAKRSPTLAATHSSPMPHTPASGVRAGGRPGRRGGRKAREEACPPGRPRIGRAAAAWHGRNRHE
jgi:hypothetical protein